MTEHPENQRSFLRAILDAIPSFVLVADQDLKIIHANRAAARLLAREPDLVLARMCGDALQCVQAKVSQNGCGSTEICPDCELRKSVISAQAGMGVVRQKAKMRLHENATTREVDFLITASPFDFDHQSLTLIVFEDVTELAELRRLLPICASCKKIRNEAQYWEQLEGYLSKHTDLQFTHGICPECIKEKYPELSKNAEIDLPEPVTKDL